MERPDIDGLACVNPEGPPFALHLGADGVESKNGEIALAYPVDLMTRCIKSTKTRLGR